MYDDLVKRLRDISNSDSNIKSNYIGLTMIQAADAIEELSRGVSVWAKRAMAWAAEAEKAEKAHRWIPVTEKPPKAYEDVLLLFPHNQAAGFCDRDGCWGVYSGDGFYTEVAENEPKPTHWARKLPEPSKEEA